MKAKLDLYSYFFITGRLSYLHNFCGPATMDFSKGCPCASRRFYKILSGASWPSKNWASFSLIPFQARSYKMVFLKIGIADGHEVFASHPP